MKATDKIRRNLACALAMVSILTFSAEAQNIQQDIDPFTIDIPREDLKDLRSRLQQVRWPDAVYQEEWSYGANSAYMKSLVNYWKESYDWKAQEQMLNQLDHYTSEVNGDNIHFIYERGATKNTTPIVLLHGWPSSFVQMLDMITRPVNQTPVVKLSKTLAPIFVIG